MSNESANREVVRTPVQAVRIDLRCGECSTGLMKFDMGRVAITYGGKTAYPHICDVCGHRETLPRRYPHFRYEEVPESAEERTR